MPVKSFRYVYSPKTTGRTIYADWIYNCTTTLQQWLCLKFQRECSCCTSTRKKQLQDRHTAAAISRPAAVSLPSKEQSAPKQSTQHLVHQRYVTAPLLVSGLQPAGRASPCESHRILAGCRTWWSTTTNLASILFHCSRCRVWRRSSAGSASSSSHVRDGETP